MDRARLIKVITSSLFYLLVLAAVLVIAGALAGWKVETVLSGSMEPAISTGGLVFIGPVGAQDIRVGDVIEFDSGNMQICHRVVAIEESPALQFTTKGDANRANDLVPAAASAVEGRVVFSIPLAGYVIYYIKTPLVLGLIILAIGLLYLGSGLTATIRERRQAKCPKEPR